MRLGILSSSLVSALLPLSFSFAASGAELEIDDQRMGDGDGILEPGEGADVWVSVTNPLDQELEGLLGSLVIEDQQVVVIDDSLAFAPIPARSPRRSEDPVSFGIMSDKECGSTVEMTIHLEGAGYSDTVNGRISMGRLEAVSETFTVEGLPAPIVDNQTTTVGVTVESAAWLGGVGVHEAHLVFDVEHSYVGDLTATLVAPDGTRVTVWSGVGSADDYHFDRDITREVAGLPGYGDWLLEVHDRASRDEGQLTSAKFILTPAHFICD